MIVTYQTTLLDESGKRHAVTVQGHVTGAVGQHLLVTRICQPRADGLDSSGTDLVLPSACENPATASAELRRLSAFSPGNAGIFFD